jgi:hypothetical protein
MGLKFMQKAQQTVQKQQEEEQVKQEDAEVGGTAAETLAFPSARVPSFSCHPMHLLQAHWVVEGAQTRCVVITEGDPLPSDDGGLAVGRLSFGYSDSKHQASLAATEGTRPEASGPDAGGDQAAGASVSDEAMAAALQRKGRQQQAGGGQKPSTDPGHSTNKLSGSQQGGKQHHEGKRRRGNADSGHDKPKQRSRYF